jgi:hypothetical protein
MKPCVLPCLCRWPCVLLVVVALAAGVAAQSEKRIVPVGTWADEPAAPAKMNVRIKQAAKDYTQYKDLGAFARVGFFDMVQPLDEQEYVALAGHALMLVTAIAREPSELPLRRTYINVGGREIELPLVSAVLSKQSDQNDRVAKIFGAYRVDALYLVPLHRRFDRADVFVDFAAHKTGLRLGEITATAFVVRDGTARSLADQPDDAALKRAIAREYPRFLKK